MIRKLFILVVLCIPQIVMAEVYISEIAWMGNSESANYEWIELYSAESISLDGWTLSAEDGVPSIALSGVIHGAYLLERNELSLSSPADLLYSGALENGGEVLVLSNADGVDIDRVDGSSGWSQIGGDNDTKETAQKVSGVWKTAAPTPGTVESVQEEVVTVESTKGYEKPELTLSISNTLRVVAGNEIAYKAEVGDTDGAHFNSALVSWNFGDGTRVQGNNIYHTYEYPGSYVLIVDAVYGRDTIQKRFVVTVRESNLEFSYIDEKAVRITNIDSEEFDLSRWRVVEGLQVFQFPKGTYILPEGSLMLSSTVSQFPFSRAVKLTFPDGREVAQKEVKKEVKVQSVASYKAPQKEVIEEAPSTQSTAQRPAAALVADQEGGKVSLWVYAWVVLVLLVGGSIVYIRRYV